MDESPVRHWYVMRDLKRPNSKTPAWKVLPELGFNVFTPMREYISSARGAKGKETRPVLPDLLFVESDRESLDKAMTRMPLLQYRFAKGSKYREPMTVPRAEMQRFMAAVGAMANPEYFLPGELSPAMVGRTVRIAAGPLAGLEGRLLKVRGARKRRVLVGLENYLYTTVEIEKDYLELL